MRKLQFLDVAYDLLTKVSRGKNQAFSFFQFPETVRSSNLHWGYPLTNEVDCSSHQFDHITLSENGF